MADTKISQLPAATTPLSGTELVPLVQSGATVQTPISDVTAPCAKLASANTFATDQTVTGTLVMASSFLRNRIINGDMRIDQRNAGASVTINAALNTYTLDRWFGVGQATDGVFTIARSSVGLVSFTNALLATVTTADASIGATQAYAVVQKLEGNNVSDLAFGTASARTITVSFWAYSSITGTFGGALANEAHDRSYPFTYAISAANTWEYKTVTIPGDTTGTWPTDNASAMRLIFSIGAGSSRKGTAGAWAAATLWSATGTSDHISTLSSIIYITGVQLEAGSAATPFERRQYGQELALCQRYYEVSSGGCLFSGNVTSASTYYHTTRYAVTKRAIPTVTPADTANTSFPAGVPTITPTGVDCFYAQKNANATAAGFFLYSWTASAEL